MFICTDEGVLINLNHLGAVLKREANPGPYNIVGLLPKDLDDLAAIQPRESNPNAKKKGRYEVVIAARLSHEEADAYLERMGNSLLARQEYLAVAVR